MRQIYHDEEHTTLAWMEHLVTFPSVGSHVSFPFHAYYCSLGYRTTVVHYRTTIVLLQLLKYWYFCMLATIS